MGRVENGFVVLNGLARDKKSTLEAYVHADFVMQLIPSPDTQTTYVRLNSVDAEQAVIQVTEKAEEITKLVKEAKNGF